MNELLLEIAALILSLYCLADSLIERRNLYLPLPRGTVETLKDRHFAFLVMLVTVAVSAAADIASSVHSLPMLSRKTSDNASTPAWTHICPSRSTSIC